MRSIPIPTMMPWLELYTPQVASKHAISNQGIQPRTVTLTWKETIFVFEIFATGLEIGFAIKNR